MSDRLYRRRSELDFYISGQQHGGGRTQTVMMAHPSHDRRVQRPRQRIERPPEPPAAPDEPKPQQTPTAADQALAQLLSAIALEEVAMAHLIRAEMEKAVHAVDHVGGEPSFDEVLVLYRSAADIVHVLARKEEMLVSKLTAVLGIAEVMAGGDWTSPEEAAEPGDRDILYAERRGHEHTLAKE